MINIAVIETDKNGDVIRCQTLLELKSEPGKAIIDLICDCKEDLECWHEYDAYHDDETKLMLNRIDQFLNE